MDQTVVPARLLHKERNEEDGFLEGRHLVGLAADRCEGNNVVVVIIVIGNDVDILNATRSKDASVTVYAYTLLNDIIE